VVGFCPLKAGLLITRCGASFKILGPGITSCESSSSSSSRIASRGSGPAPSSYSSEDDPGLSRFAVFDDPEPDDFDVVGLSGYRQSRPPFLHPREDKFR
jgi:hypothetical protein